MTITNESKFRWVRPIASHLSEDVRVWQPMLLQSYPSMLGGMKTEYLSCYNVGHDPEDCEFGEWIEHRPLPKFGIFGRCNRQLSRAESDLCTLDADHLGLCANRDDL